MTLPSLFAGGLILAAATTISLTVNGAYSDGPVRYFDVTADFDGDGSEEPRLLRVTCDSTRMTDSVITAREAGSGLATGRRQYQPLLLRNLPTRKISAGWDLATAKGARTAAPSSQPITLARGTPNLCE